MFEEISQVRTLRKKYNAKLLLSGIGTFREIQELEANALRDGALPRKYKELIALGISITHACYGCIEYHVSSSADLGASRKEILETAAVALTLAGSLAEWPARFVFKVLDELERGAENKAVEGTSSPGTP